jgi:molybdate/tungstate transport system substrate-binding protein
MEESIVESSQPPQRTVRVCHAGSLNAVVGRDVAPAFTDATGIAVEHEGGASVDLANAIRDGQIAADVFVSADAEVNDEVLMGPENGDVVRWYVIVCRQRMVLAYSPASRFRADFEAATEGRTPWYAVLQRPGLILKRSDPALDPGGYRAVFALALAEAHYGIPGLRDAILGGDDNAAQIAAGGYEAIQRGETDALLTYVTNAVNLGLPYVELPPEVDQSDPTLARLYATVSYTNPRSQTFRGTPLVYGAAIPTTAPHPEEAAAFLAYLLSEPGRSALSRRGFLPSAVLLAGDSDAVPAALRGLIEGRYAAIQTGWTGLTG